MNPISLFPTRSHNYALGVQCSRFSFSQTHSHLDVGIGDAIIAGPEWLISSDVLGFAAIPPARVAALSREQQFAEKIHAYTLPPGDRTNTRIKDLIDLLLLLRIGLPGTDMVKQALRATFARRATHAIPQALTPPPRAWQAAFEQLAAEVDLTSMTLDAAFDELAAYWAL
jgi:Nucleotidyl transferase AbiEii toxin, Type IV TA system